VSFLDEEEVDSGIVLSRGPQLRFWHLTFEEYLAARAVAGLGESAQWKLLFDRDRLYQPEWREVLLLLAGILHVKQGRSKVDGLIQTTLDRLGHTPSLVNLARCAGLLGAILADLRPLKYHCPDPRYQQVLSAALGIFGKSQSKAIDIQTRLEAAEALGQAGDPRLTRDNWVTLPAGRFLMGAQDKSPDRPNYDPEAYSDEPVREVAVESFQLGRYPVTVAEYNRFIEDGGHDNPAWWSQGGHGGRTLPGGWDEQILHLNRPVVNVNWYGASAYCAWAKCRLPSEQEWEYAARGTEGRKYPWGSEPPTPDRANYDETKLGAASPVGLFPLGATPEGIEDMAGNVLEWTSSQYEQKDARVLRGGAWDDVVPRYLRAVYRYRLDPGNRIDNIGFRCARELS
jgi:formylglycine-generating enzyme required for sulfatase activity